MLRIIFIIKKEAQGVLLIRKFGYFFVGAGVLDGPKKHNCYAENKD